MSDPLTRWTLYIYLGLLFLEVSRRVFYAYARRKVRQREALYAELSSKTLRPKRHGE